MMSDLPHCGVSRRLQTPRGTSPSEVGAMPQYEPGTLCIPLQGSAVMSTGWSGRLIVRRPGCGASEGPLGPHVAVALRKAAKCVP